MASSEGKIFEKAACKYCGDEISTNSLARHEKDCQNATPQKRALRKRQREERTRYNRAQKTAAAGTNRQRYRQSVSIPRISPDTPVVQQRHSHHKPIPLSKRREYQAEYQRRYAERRKANGGLPLLKAIKHARRTLAHSTTQANGFITFQVRVDRAHLLTLLAKMAQADNSLVSIETDDLV